MNPNKLRDRETGHGSGAQETSKKLAVKELIERYYYQLTDGCGRQNCPNQHCASNGRLGPLSPNDAAARALQLVVAKAELCVGTAKLSADLHNHQAPCRSGTSGTDGATSRGASLAVPTAAASCNSALLEMDLDDECTSRASPIHVTSTKGEVLGRSGADGTSSRGTSLTVPTTAATCNSGLQEMDLDDECTSRASPIHVTSTKAKQSAANCGGVGASSAPQPGLVNSQDMEIDLYCTFAPATPVICNQQTPPESKESPSQDRGRPKQTTPRGAPRVCHMLTYELLLELMEECEGLGNYTPLIHALGQVYSRVGWLKRSFPRRPQGEPSGGGLSKEELRAMETDMDKDEDCQEATEAAGTGSPGADDFVSRLNGPVNQEITVDIESVRLAYDALFSIPDQPFSSALVHAIMILCENLEIGLRYHGAYQRNPSLLNVFAILLELPLLEGPFCSGTVQALCRACALLPLEAHERLARHCGYNCPPHRLRNVLNALHQVLTTRVIEGHFSREFGPGDDEVIVVATKTMKIFFMASVLGGQLEQSADTVDEDCTDKDENPLLAADRDPTHPKEDPLCELLGVKMFNYLPFYVGCTSPAVESDSIAVLMGKITFLEKGHRLKTVARGSGIAGGYRVFILPDSHFSLDRQSVNAKCARPLMFRSLRWAHIAMVVPAQLELVAMESPSSLKKQLVVEFEGEQGIDEGGVSKEFFQLVVEEIFNPDIAMFTLNAETQTYWFNPTSFESDAQFKLIGIILGLAIYNNVILDVHFPMVVYRKLMGRKGTFYDLKDWNPALASGLQQLLDYSGEDMEETFVQSFRISYQDVFGSVLSHDLKENGDSLLVNQDNKWEFVDLYADFLLNKSVEKQFRAFRRGFLLVTDDSPLETLFRPEEVELLVCGSKNFDFNALEESTEYDGGYCANTPIIRHFWELVHEFSQEQKRKLLQFATGSDRVPVGGLSKLKLVVARHGTDSDRLPTAHTCFNVLLLPEYSSKEKLEDRLLKAINYSKGFGMF
ncbi:unnamed protein product [Ixodes persulcatus]